MRAVCALLLLAGFYPLSRAWSANRRTTLRDSLLWAAWAWLAWLLVFAERVTRTGGWLGNYLALALTGCAGVAVLGARRPVVGAWNFVVLGLLAVLLLPVVPPLLGLGEERLETAHRIFLGAVLAALVVNYLPTRLGPGALLLGAGCALEVAALARADVGGLRKVSPWLIAASPWAALLGVSWGLAPASEMDRVWRAFRDRYGLFWGERQREQFNRAAGNAGWPLSLGWGGVRRTGAGEAPEPSGPLKTLHAVLKRFGPPTSEDQRRDQ
jgi:hypothetical protein